jgi:hypothetical protein
MTAPCGLVMQRRCGFNDTDATFLIEGLYPASAAWSRKHRGRRRRCRKPWGGPSNCRGRDVQSLPAALILQIRTAASGSVARSGGAPGSILISAVAALWNRLRCPVGLAGGAKSDRKFIGGPALMQSLALASFVGRAPPRARMAPNLSAPRKLAVLLPDGAEKGCAPRR